MIEVKKTNASDPDFVALVKKLDAYLSVTDEDEHDFYDQYNKLDSIKYVVLVYDDKVAVGCGAIKRYDAETMEVKRMFVNESSRGRGHATSVIVALEEWAVELGFSRCILETGIRQPEAVALYKKCGYKVTKNYGQYIGVENSLCFSKDL